MNTAEPRLLRVEVAADLPVLWATLGRLDLPAILDRHFPAPPHCKGPLTPGEVLALWLLFVVSGRPLPQPRPALGRPAPGRPLRPPGQSGPAHPRPRRPPRRLAHPAGPGRGLRGAG